MRPVLMIAFHFPPLAGSSGIQRTLRFAQYLPEHDWQPLVLTASPRAFDRTSDDLMREVPADLVVRRSFALNSARHLAIHGRYPAVLARPDRWIIWALSAIPAGLRLIKRYRPVAIWSTYPIATAHVVGRWVSRLSGLPWVADFRDPMAQDGYPEDPATWRSFERIERNAVERAAASVFVSRGAAAMYQRRYPGAADRITVIENGFDEQSYAGIPSTGAPLVPGRRTLLHSGIVYPSERDPRQLLAALAALKRSGRAGDLLVRFRASAHDDLLRDLARRHDVADLIDLAPPLPYREALEEMHRADALLVLQASNCNEQIPAKAYEYLRTHRPVLALTDPNGDTADLLRRCGVRYIAPLDDAVAIERILPEFLTDLGGAVPSAPAVAACSRESRTRELATLLDRVAAR
ncbi:MAG TPA: glycosyltransferase [Burkholderiaceae bacterium]|nr:glycosyltransferase [Burkholderiaceae bacterium]